MGSGEIWSAGVKPDVVFMGDSITCAAIGVDATELDLPVALDRTAYRRAL